ncbi:MAG: uracil-DNA glycosylase [Burkholderiales bacterium]
MKFSDAALKEMGLHPLWKARRGNSPEIPQHIDIIEENSKPSAQPSDQRSGAIMRMDALQLVQSIAGCTQCSLHQSRHNSVPGVGLAHAKWMFVGEAPGNDEDEKGQPFVGQAGKLLDNMFAALGLSREKDVFITNVVKCHPPANRNPSAQEISACAPYLERQISLVQPKLIIALGKIAADHLLGYDATIASLRGKIYAVQGVPLIVTYHPAYLLRTPVDKAKTWEDLCFARAAMAGISAQTASAE